MSSIPKPISMITKRLAIAVGLVVTLGVLWALPDRAVFWSPDEGGKYLDLLQMTSPVHLNHPLPYPGRTLDPDLKRVPLLYYRQQGTQLYSWWPSWFPALSMPFYRASGPKGLLSIPLLSGLLISIVVAHAVSDSAGAIGYATWLMVVGSPILFYSFTFWEHTLHTLLVLLASLFAVQGWQRADLRWHGLSGGLLGLALYLRIETVLFAAGIGLTTVLRIYQQRNAHERSIRSMHQLGILAFCFTVVAFPFLIINVKDTGHILGRAYSAHYKEQYLVEYPNAHHPARAEVIPNLLVGTRMHNGADLPSGLRWLFVLVTGGSALWPWLHKQKLDAISIICVLILVTLCSRVLFSAERYTSVHGLVLSAPWIVLAGWACDSPKAASPTRYWGYLGMASSLAFLGASLLQGWEGQGGLQWGPRYALPIYPILTIGAARGIDQAITRRTTAQRWLIGAMITLIVLGIGLEARGIRSMIISKHAYATWDERIQSLPQDAAITTESEWLALTLPGVYTRRIMHNASADELLNSSWQAQAYQAGYRQLCQIYPRLPLDIDIICHTLTEP